MESKLTHVCRRCHKAITPKEVEANGDYLDVCPLCNTHIDVYPIEEERRTVDTIQEPCV